MGAIKRGFEVLAFWRFRVLAWEVVTGFAAEVHGWRMVTVLFWEQGPGFLPAVGMTRELRAGVLKGRAGGW